MATKHKTTDFTKMRMHRLVSNPLRGRIELCPKCGRKGILSEYAPKLKKDTVAGFTKQYHCTHTYTSKGIVLGIFHECETEDCWQTVDLEGAELQAARDERRKTLEAQLSHARQRLERFNQAACG